ncbi:MAG: excinuclease ABC subunit UvrA [Candidatus Paceibacterota bacterium]
MPKTKSSKTTEYIEIEGAKVHNLKNVSVKIPKNKLVVVCGVSGSGKSSLAFDTLYEEGQRRYLEGLSSYVRQFLGGFKKPDVHKITGLSPTLAINQKSISSNPRSTVGTITEIYDHFRLLFARVGVPHCPDCHIPITAQTPQHIAQQIIELSKEDEVILLAPIIQGKKGEHKAVLDEIQKSGYPRVRIDGYVYALDEAIQKTLDKNKTHSIEVVIGNVMTGFKIDIQKNISKAEKEALKKKKKKLEHLAKEEESEVIEKVRKALHIGNGIVLALTRPLGKISEQEKKKETVIRFSERYACSRCGFSMPEIEPRLFSFNAPYGACTTCQGLGTKLEIDLGLLIAPEISLEAGAIIPWYSLSQMGRRSLGVTWQKFVTETILQQNNISVRTPFKDIPKHIRDIILYGDVENKIRLENGDWEGETFFEGVIPRLERLYYETDSEFIRHELSKHMMEKTCPACQGARLKPEVLAVLLNDKNIWELASLSAENLKKFLVQILSHTTVNSQTIAQPIIKEIIAKTQFLIDVGLDYITVGRSATTLSVGENQRIRLATQLGSGLSGVIYVLDEPTIGLHPQDTDRLIETLKYLRDLGNTVVVVEHDDRVITAADWVIEIGPFAGEKGGQLIFEGTPAQLKKSNSLTGQYFSGKKKVFSGMPKQSINPERSRISLFGASQFNLKNVDLHIPIRSFVAIAGISGSGKSTLMLDVFAKALQKEVAQLAVVPGAYKKLEGTEHVDKIIIIDQSPIGKTPRSNPATYTGIFTYIRTLFARLQESQVRGYTPSYFSFNVRPGRCEACKGEGYKKVEMYFLPDMYVECDTCKGTRFSPEVLDVKYQGKHIADVLNMSVSEALIFFASFSQIADKLQLLEEIGLGYMKLGQAATTLSGGEAQRIKLAEELSKRFTGRTLYVLDEPTVGLHFDDTRKLLFLLRSLVQKGNTVTIIEHNLDVLKEADWMIELGPKGGDGGGKIVFEGTIADAKKKGTATGKYL